jgi:hypothetical protein
LSSGQYASGNGLTAQERLTHDGSVARVIAGVTSLVEREVSCTLGGECEGNFTLGAGRGA